MVALNKVTGDVIWKAQVPAGNTAHYASAIVADVDGQRQYIQFLGGGVVGVAAGDGKFLWRYENPEDPCDEKNEPPPFIASVLNFVGAFLSISVAATIAKGIVEQGDVTLEIIFAGLVGAILWNVLTWYLSIPSSSSHALIGGIIGSVLAAVGSSGVRQQRRRAERARA
jgi:outer membrane protein assembly factor BamB